MLQNILYRLEDLLYWLPGIIIALTFHEWGHAFAALKMGDPTARNMGRLTLNPLKHIDPLGLLLMALVHFGWAKPVPVNPRNYHNYRRGEIVVSLAGVTMNFILAFISMLALSITIKTGGVSSLVQSEALIKLTNVVINFIWINLALMTFNLIPIFPLDGFHIAEVLLAKPLGPKPFLFLRKYGQFILIGLLLLSNFMMFSPIGWVVSRIVDGLGTLFAWAFNCPEIALLFSAM